MTDDGRYAQCGPGHRCWRCSSFRNVPSCQSELGAVRVFRCIWDLLRKCHQHHRSQDTADDVSTHLMIDRLLQPEKSTTLTCWQRWYRLRPLHRIVVVLVQWRSRRLRDRGRSYTRHHRCVFVYVDWSRYSKSRKITRADRSRGCSRGCSHVLSGGKRTRHYIRHAVVVTQYRCSSRWSDHFDPDA